MRTFPRVRSKFLPFTAVIVVLSCAPGHIPQTIDGGARSPCVIADTTASTPDTIRVIGAISEGPWQHASGIDCQLQPLQSFDAPAVVALVPPNGADLRDALEGRLLHMGVPQPDIVVSRDPDLLDFARRRAGYLVQPLPWNTTYILVTVGDDAAPSALTDAQREALARDAVTGDARGAMGPFGWLTDRSCLHEIAEATSAQRPIVVYPTGDAIARQIAERVVSLAAAGSRPAWLPAVLGRNSTTGARVASIRQDSITSVLTTSRAAAAIIPVARDWTTPCGTRDNLPLPRGAIPLVDARDHIIVRRGSGAAVLIDASGALRAVKRGAR